MNKLRLIEVPWNSKDHYITDSGFLRFLVNTATMQSSKAVTVDFVLDKNLHEIAGYTGLNGIKYIVIKNK